MKDQETFDDRHPILNHPYLHYGVTRTTLAFAAGVDSGDCVILVDGAHTVTLPPAANFAGAAFYIKQLAATASNIAVSGGNTIDGGAGPLAIAGQNDAFLVVSDGITGWWVVAEYDA